MTVKELITKINVILGDYERELKEKGEDTEEKEGEEKKEEGEE